MTGSFEPPRRRDAGVLLTGASGGIGRFLEPALLGATSSPVYSVTSSGRAVLGHRVSCDLTADVGALATELRDLSFSAIVHAARGRSGAQDLAMLDNLLQVGAEKKVGLFVFFSSWVVHSRNEKPDDYTRTKRASERLVREACGRHGIDYLIVRPSLVAGPGLIWSTKLLGWFGSVVPPEIQANVIHVRDVARMVLLLMGREELYDAAHDLGGPTLPLRQYCRAIRHPTRPAEPGGEIALPPGLFRFLARRSSTLWFLGESLSGFTPEKTWSSIGYEAGFDPRALDEERRGARPGTERELLEVLARHGEGNVRSVGRGLSFLLKKEPPPLHETRLFFDRYAKVVELTATDVTVQAGTTLNALVRFLSEHERTLATLPEFLDVSVGACLETPVHGSNLRHANVAGLARSAKIVRNGEIELLERGRPEFAEFLFDPTDRSCILEVTFEHCPVTRLEKRTLILPDEELFDGRFLEYFRDHESVTVEWYPGRGELMLWLIDPTDERRRDRPFYVSRHFAPVALPLARWGRKRTVGTAPEVLAPWNELTWIQRAVITAFSKRPGVELAVPVAVFPEFLEAFRHHRRLVTCVGFRAAARDPGVVHSPSFLSDVIYSEVVMHERNLGVLSELRERFDLRCHVGKRCV